MNRRKYVYIAAGVIILIALAIASIVILNKNNADKAKNTNATETSNSTQNASDSAVSGNVKTPSDNTELTNALNDDASSIETDLKNYENNDYKDTNLSDDSLYN